MTTLFRHRSGTTRTAHGAATMTSADAQAYCTTLTKKSGSNFYYSFLFLPKARRDAMYTVYAFCKEVDNAVDEPPPEAILKTNWHVGGGS